MKKKAITKPPMSLGQYIDRVMAEHTIPPPAEVSEFGLSSEQEAKLPKRAMKEVIEMNKKFVAPPSWQATAAFVLVLMCGADEGGEIYPSSDTYWERIQKASNAASTMTDRCYMLGLDLITKGRD